MAKRKAGKTAEDTDKADKKKGRYRRFLLWVFQHKEPDEATGELRFSRPRRCMNAWAVTR